ncbi:MAG TPA: TIGR03013 family XrtA/PEP-CTERM system glycosyltransferase [Bryobacteraceae bacterium]|nr:TIGR03013 family XrtA/PEP-CTERM system glycosyltransferase [Bryobacteraceae bacterium]
MIRIFNQYVSPKSVLLMLTEGALIALALLCGVRLRFWGHPEEIQSVLLFPDIAIQGLIVIVIFQLCFYYSDLYNLNLLRGRSEQLICLGQSLGSACLLLGALYYIFPGLLIGRGIFLISVFLVGAFVTINRVVLDRAWQLAAPRQNILILGAENMALNVARELTARDDLNVTLVGFVEGKAGDSGPSKTIFGRPVIGVAEDLELLAVEHHVGRIIVALEDRRGRLPVRDLVRLRVQGVRVEDVHTTMSALSGKIWLESIHPSWFVFSDGFHRSRLVLAVKRALDLSFGMIGLAVSLPVMVLVAIAVKLDSPGPALFRQQRVGFAGKTFDVLKFRSMRVDAEKANGAQWAAPDDPRTTRVGRFIRKFRLDELPQFINVIRGEMSFVGPRPERPVFVEQLRKEISYYDERHSVRPGITGWAQVRYPYGATVDDALRKLEYDLFYLKNMSIFFDCAIVLQTIRTVLTGKGGR